MKAVAILNALSINHWAFEKIDGCKTSIQLAVEHAQNFSQVTDVCILTDQECGFTFPEPIRICRVSEFSSKIVFHAIADCASGFDAVYIVDADAPLVDPQLANKLFEQHKHYKAEYTFSEGFPAGLAPQLLDTGLVKILSNISALDNVKNNRNFIFDCIKQNINSYDIEVLVADHDAQNFRINLYADSKRNTMLCRQLKEINGENYFELINQNKKALFTLPAFYAIEICNSCAIEKTYLPLLQTTEKKFLPLTDFKKIIDKIVEYSDDAVISLSIIGEPFLHPDILKIIEYVLQQKNLSLLMETAGTLLNTELIKKIKELQTAAQAHNTAKIFWIVYVDAMTPQTFAVVSRLDTQAAPDKQTEQFNKVCTAVTDLHNAFGADVYPQFIRMTDNENELESFYHFWKDKLGNVLIQKYDSLARQLPDKRVADLSPVVRNACWHLMRDMYILENGDVLCCKTDIVQRTVVGNVLTESIADIRKKIFGRYDEHINKEYKGLCKNCDEYYTFNF